MGLNEKPQRDQSIPTFKMAAIRSSGGLQVSAMDSREYGSFTLPNGLDVVVVSDPKTEQAAAAMAVGVGFLADPDDIPGLAHFCEHMLFLGTASYPDENAFQSFISAHCGSTNAYTTSIHTTFYFDIAPPHLEVALDYFSAFFTSPLFTQSATEREMQAVASEHAANLQSDAWRHQQVLRAVGNQHHAYSKFGTGTAETLNQPHVRDALLAHYATYYTAGRMKLVVCGQEDVAELRAMVTARFSDVPMHSPCVCHPNQRNLAGTAAAPCPLLFNTDDQAPYMPAQLRRHVKIVPVMDQHLVHLLFPVPPISPHVYGIDAHGLLGELLGHEGSGSLLAIFKAQQWANSLSAGVYNDEVEWTFFTISIDCTDDGLAHIHDMVALAFAMIARVRAEPRAALAWRVAEYAALYRLEVQFHEKEDPASYCAHLAARLHWYPPEFCVKGDVLCEELCLADYDATLAALVPANLLLVSVSSAYAETADVTEPWYGTKYSVEDLAPELLAAWSAAEASHPDMALYGPNAFVPDDLTVLPTIGEAAPTLLRDDAHCRCWHVPDHTFKQPKVYLSLRITSGALSMNPYSTVFTDMFVEIVQEVLNPLAYDAARAGLSYSLHEGPTSLTLTVDGFSATVPKFTAMLLARMTTLADVSEALYNRVHETRRRKYDNQLTVMDPQTHADWAAKELLYSYFAGASDLADAIAAWTWPEFRAMAQRLFRQSHITGLMHGNLTTDAAIAWTNDIVSMVQAVPSAALPPDYLSYSRIVELPAATASIYQVVSCNADNCNSVVRVLYQITPLATTLVPNSYWTNCAALFAQLTMDLCFATLRTEEQLGYTVSSGLTTMGNILYYSVLVESSSHSPADVHRRIDAFHRRCRQYLVDLPLETFQKHVQSIVQSWLQGPTTLVQETSRVWGNILLHLPPRITNANDAMMLQSLHKADIVAFYDEFIDLSQGAVLGIHVYGRAFVDQMAPVTDVVGSIAAFKAARGLFPRPCINPQDEQTFTKTAVKCWD
ncbi:insulin-degrading-like enzyme, metalloprotease family M16A [Achlya hypogyna]|uniref:Insulin-degrading-like enzyme, metalloprotease family M16A n=1 Tax=Achlya hypogyna TaxID=1202772 RepID=A0A1V9YU17_ACHHY|nr:insulin-degrading-like enzyme, metalloprotease family M16A [Achlya hypogyna]